MGASGEFLKAVAHARTGPPGTLVLTSADPSGDEVDDVTDVVHHNRDQGLDAAAARAAAAVTVPST